MQGQWRQEREPGSPARNMAADEAVFEAVRRGEMSVPVVRVYQWDRTSVSFGRLQDEDAVREAYPHLPVIRRPTGGLAVEHGNDITVSVITRQEWLPGQETRGVLSSYRQIVAGLLESFHESGVPASLGGAGDVRERGAVDCFASLAACDVADKRTGRKIMGSAQRRQDGAILQQMSIPLSALPDPALFLTHARHGLRRAMGLEEWLLIDTHPPV